MYEPLPDYLTIKPSGIHGLGLFATKAIPPGTNMGVSHHFIEDLIVRTPLGGFVNHSEDNFNCKLEKSTVCAHLVSIKDISQGEELTLYYGWYKPPQ